MRAWGEPRLAQRNDVGLSELDYGSVVFRFQDSGRLEEVTQQASVLTLGKVAVPFASLALFGRKHDDVAFEQPASSSVRCLDWHSTRPVHAG